MLSKKQGRTLLSRVLFAVAMVCLLAGVLGAGPAGARQAPGQPGGINVGLPVPDNSGILGVTVYDRPTGAPIAGAMVYIYNEVGLLEAKGPADENGYFSAQLSPAMHIVNAFAPGYEPGAGLAMVTTGTQTYMSVKLMPNGLR